MIKSVFQMWVRLMQASVLLRRNKQIPYSVNHNEVIKKKTSYALLLSSSHLTSKFYNLVF